MTEKELRDEINDALRLLSNKLEIASKKIANSNELLFTKGDNDSHIISLEFVGDKIDSDIKEIVVKIIQKVCDRHKVRLIEIKP